LYIGDTTERNSSGEFNIFSPLKQRLVQNFAIRFSVPSRFHWKARLRASIWLRHEERRFSGTTAPGTLTSAPGGEVTKWCTSGQHVLCVNEYDIEKKLHTVYLHLHKPML